MTVALRSLTALHRHSRAKLKPGLTPDHIIDIIVQVGFYVGLHEAEDDLTAAQGLLTAVGIDFYPTTVSRVKYRERP